MKNITAKLSTYLFNNLQLGLIIFVIKNDIPLIYGFLFYLVFELVILFDCIVKFGSQKLWLISLFLSSLAMVFAFKPTIATSDIFVQIVAYISLGVCVLSLKKIRTLNNALGTIKKYWRAFGYLTAYFFSPYLMAGGALILLIMCFRTPNMKETPSIFMPELSKNTIVPYLIILFHHLYYFSYVYFIPVIVNNFKYPLIYFGPIFYIGWAGYYLFDSLKRFQFEAVFLGHLIGAFAVFGFIYSTNFFVLMVLWFITGVGGGTIILVRNFYSKSNRQMYEHFKTYESFGHLLGILSFGTGITLNSPKISFIVGGISGLLCAALAIGVILLKKPLIPANR